VAKIEAGENQMGKHETKITFRIRHWEYGKLPGGHLL
jgi:hypothetical protein